MHLIKLNLFIKQKKKKMNLCVSKSISMMHTDYGNDAQHGAEQTRTQTQTRAQQQQRPSLFVRVAMRVSRAKWFSFLRRVFHYQNGVSSPLGTNPFNSSSWMLLELLALVSQIIATVVVISVSKDEKPVWPMRIWAIGYDLGCVMSLLVLYWRYGHYHYDGISLTNMGQQCTTNEDSRKLQLVNKCKASLDLFYAMWFVMGNVWVFDTRFGSTNQAPKLQALCITILAWNAVTYSFPFLLFLLLCICVPLFSSLIGYNMSLGSVEKGASHDQISKLICWRFKQVVDDCCLEGANSSLTNNNPVCCICLNKYKEREEIRELPCSHIFHKDCVDQWLGIISCCPLCKRGLDI